MPTILAVSCAIITHSFWSMTMLVSMAAFSLGYGDDSVFRRIFGNGWGRGVWGLLGALSLSLGLFITGHIGLMPFLAYIVINFVLENALKNVNQKIGDPIIGLGFSSIVFIVH